MYTIGDVVGPLACSTCPAGTYGKAGATSIACSGQCLPGTYNASTQKRFFRVRAVEK
jgi:hypothetical protein